MTEFNDKLYFTADDGKNGNELWVSDGTAEGTQLVADIRPRSGSNGYGYYNSNPTYLTVVGDELFFSAIQGNTGSELFKLTLDDSINIIDGTDDAEYLIGGNGAEKITGLDGKDTLDGNAGNDTLIGGDGKDSLIGRSGDDFLLGEDGEDTLDGGDNKDILLGDDGEDILIGGAGDDILSGEDGEDLLDGGAGNDILTGGDSSDVFMLRSKPGVDIIVDFEFGSDRLGLADGLQFDNLSFADNTILIGNELLATLNGINTEQLTSSELTTV